MTRRVRWERNIIAGPIEGSVRRVPTCDLNAKSPVSRPETILINVDVAFISMICVIYMRDYQLKWEGN